MFQLDQSYLEELEALAAEIQSSEELQNYLDTEEEEDFARLKEMFEPRISLIYDKVADKDPLQLLPLEVVLLDAVFEGLYLPKILGYSVLRGEINEHVKYVRPQNHFKDVLLTICQSANFDILRKRIGQSIQIGFAMSSDIWITNLINTIDNKRIRYFLQGQKLEKYRIPKERLIGHSRFKRQFKNDNYQSTEFPESVSDLPLLFSGMKNFLIYRIRRKGDNASLIPPLKEIINRADFIGTDEHLQIMQVFALFFDLEKVDKANLAAVFNKTRSAKSDFTEKYLDALLELYSRKDIFIDEEADNRVYEILDDSIEDDLTRYYQLMNTLHTKGYVSDEAQSAIKVFCNQNAGLSVINACVRQAVYRYFNQAITGLNEIQYARFFEVSRVFPIYMAIFSNQQFNQDLKDLSMTYVRKLLKRYTDKRGKDYQDIKKFVSTTFQDLNFLKEKEVVELFKTRRKKKKEEAS